MFNRDIEKLKKESKEPLKKASSIAEIWSEYDKDGFGRVVKKIDSVEPGFKQKAEDIVRKLVKTTNLSQDDFEEKLKSDLGNLAITKIGRAHV